MPGRGLLLHALLIIGLVPGCPAPAPGPPRPALAATSALTSDISHDPTKCVQNKKFVWCLPADYNKEKHPFAYFHLMNATLPLKYDFKFVIDEISNINDKAQTLSFAMYFAVSWLEPRLVINTSASEWTEAKTGPRDQVNESPENLKYLWYPELEIYGLETFGRQRVLKEMSGVRVMRNRTINYELGVRVTISCKMMFDDYPLDAHSCQFQVGSYYDTVETVLCSSQFLYNSARQRSLQHFIQLEPLPKQFSVVHLPSGHYAACGFQVRLQRKQMQYQIQVYLPSFMFVVTSWVSFLIKPEVVPGRMALLVTLFLVLINIFNSVREQAPISSRLNAVDLYLVVCVFFVFSALMEYASILMLLKKRRKPVRTIDEGLSTVMPGLGRNGELARRGQRGSHRQNKNGAEEIVCRAEEVRLKGEGENEEEELSRFPQLEPGRERERLEAPGWDGFTAPPAASAGRATKLAALPDSVTPHKQALCDNIDAWALWVSPPVFFIFNLVYWLAYQHLEFASELW